MIIYQCTVRGIGSTVWQGTAFRCSNSDGTLILQHIQSTFVNDTDECADDTAARTVVAIAQGVEIIQNSTDKYYISQLKLTVRSETDNKTVQCVHDNGTQEDIVGTTTVTIVTTTGIHAK